MGQKFNPLLAWFSLILLMFFLPSAARAGSTTSTFNFSANFIGGACEVSVPATLRFNNGDVILPSEIFGVSESGTPITTVNFNLTLINCAGQGLTPKIRLSGNTELICDSTMYKNNATGAGSAVGYGVLLRTEGNAFFKANTNMAFNKNITPNSWSTGTRLETLTNSVLPIKAVLRTGSCTNNARLGGELKANVTFDFIYE